MLKFEMQLHVLRHHFLQHFFRDKKVRSEVDFIFYVETGVANKVIRCLDITASTWMFVIAVGSPIMLQEVWFGSTPELAFSNFKIAFLVIGQVRGRRQEGDGDMIIGSNAPSHAPSTRTRTSPRPPPRPRAPPPVTARAEAASEGACGGGV
jgi:hypothetical protein